MTAPVPLSDADLAVIEARARRAHHRGRPVTPEARQTLAETITPTRDDTGDVERGSWEGQGRPLNATVPHETILAGIRTRAERQNGSQPLAPCRDCGREKPVNQWCTATEECRAHTDAALEAEEQRREAGR